MNVKELKEKLAEYPDTWQVEICFDGDERDFDHVEAEDKVVILW
jgi:hypothetical protein